MLLPLGLLCGLGLPACSSTPEEDGADVGVVDPDAGRADAARTDAGRSFEVPTGGLRLPRTDRREPLALRERAFYETWEI